MSRKRAMFYVLICALLWSTGGVLVKLIDANAFTIAGWRSLIALPVLLFIYRPKMLRFTKKVWLIALSLTFTGVLFVLANKLTTAANAIVLQYCSPVFIIAMNAAFYKERVKKSDVLASVGCMAGMTLFFLDELSPGNMLGNIIAIISGVTNALLFVWMNRTDEDRGTIAIAAQIETIVLCLPFMILFPPAFTLKMAVALVALGAFQRGLSMVIYAKASGNCSSMDAILISMAEPLCNPILVMLFFHEIPGKFALAGGAVVIATVLLWNVTRVKSAEA